jgi:hypothetical protein
MGAGRYHKIRWNVDKSSSLSRRRIDLSQESPQAPGIRLDVLIDYGTSLCYTPPMARITLTEASRITGAARSTLYRAIHEGRLTREPDGTVDTVELLRAGFALQRTTSDTGSG